MRSVIGWLPAVGARSLEPLLRSLRRVDRLLDDGRLDAHRGVERLDQRAEDVLRPLREGPLAPDDARAIEAWKRWRARVADTLEDARRRRVRPAWLGRVARLAMVALSSSLVVSVPLLSTPASSAAWWGQVLVGIGLELAATVMTLACAVVASRCSRRRREGRWVLVEGAVLMALHLVAALS